MNTLGYSVLCLKNMLLNAYWEGNSSLIVTKYYMVCVTFFYLIDISLLSTICKILPEYSQYIFVKVHYTIVMDLAFHYKVLI